MKRPSAAQAEYRIVVGRRSFNAHDLVGRFAVGALEVGRAFGHGATIAPRMRAGVIVLNSESGICSFGKRRKAN